MKTATVNLLFDAVQVVHGAHELVDVRVRVQALGGGGRGLPRRRPQPRQHRQRRLSHVTTESEFYFVC